MKHFYPSGFLCNWHDAAPLSCGVNDLISISGRIFFLSGQPINCLKNHFSNAGPEISTDADPKASFSVLWLIENQRFRHSGLSLRFQVPEVRK